MHEVHVGRRNRLERQDLRRSSSINQQDPRYAAPGSLLETDPDIGPEGEEDGTSTAMARIFLTETCTHTHHPEVTLATYLVIVKIGGK